MFLSLKEIKDSKLRYSLLIGIVFLIATVVLFLAGLASGLADGFKEGIVAWNATGVVLNKDSNKIVEASRLTVQDLDSVKASKKAPVGFSSALISKKIEDDSKTNIAVFGINSNSFIAPKLTKGNIFKNNGEVVLGSKLADELKVKIGDTVHIGSLKEKLTVVGLTEDMTYSMSPIVYTSIPTLSNIKFGTIPEDSNQTIINGIVVKDTNIDDVKLTDKQLDKNTIDEFIDNLPGYSAQSLTLNTMVYVLIGIAAIVIGIFMYVLTMQKKQLFGILKAQGISTKTIAISVISQSFIIAFVGSLLSFIITFGISFILPGSLPFSLHLNEWLMYCGLLTIIATLGGVFCVPGITKIDPITAIGG